MKKLTLSTIIASALLFNSASALEGFSPNVDEKGAISYPADFRVNMIHLGSWFVPEGDASGFHDVYTEAASAKHYRETGKFPDGATVVKELRPHNTGNYTTGSGVSYATGDVKQTFVMVKDTTDRFAGNANWGKGWGWALFKGDNSENVSANYEADCLGCHVPAQANDWLYTEAYPTLTK